MSLTLSLLGKTAPRLRQNGWMEVLRVVTDRLVATYGRPLLGNLSDPVKEMFYILLSAKTTERLYQLAYRRLDEAFPTLEQLATAPENEIAACVQVAGLGQRRARQIQALAKRLLDDWGRCAAEQIRQMDAATTFTYLTGLPGLGPKSAFCVMMMSLDFDVFPVDVNVSRVLARLGAVPSGMRHEKAQAVIPEIVPAGRSRDLHVGLVVHGRSVCTPLSPRCGDCFLADLCKYGRRRKRHPGRSEGHRQKRRTFSAEG